MNVEASTDKYTDCLKFFKKYDPKDCIHFNHLALSDLIKMNQESASFME